MDQRPRRGQGRVTRTSRRSVSNATRTVDAVNALSTDAFIPASRVQWAGLFRASALVITAVVAMSGAVPSATQLTDVLSAKWRDGEIRSQVIPSTGETEISLGLLPSGQHGTLVLVLAARVQQRVPAEPPGTLQVHIGAGLHVNPNVIRRPVLRFVLDGKGPKGVTIDASDRLRTLEPSSLDNASATITFVEFVQLLRADVITGEIFGLEVSFTPQQRAELRDFGMRVLRPAR